MVKKVLALLTALLLLASAALAAEITVCDGTVSSAKVPFESATAGTKYQKTGMFYYASDLSGLKAGDVIDSITYYVSQPASANTGATYEVYLEEAADDALAVGLSRRPLVKVDNATLVYRGALEPRSSTLTIPFNEGAFTYQGGNLVVRVYRCVLSPNRVSSDAKFFVKTMSNTKQTMYVFSEASVADYDSNYNNSSLPKMTLHVQDPAPETGDGTPIALLCAAAAISAAAVVAMNKRRVQA